MFSGKSLTLTFALILCLNGMAGEDLPTLIQQAENLIEKTYAAEELTQKYYKDSVRKILDSKLSDEEKAGKINAVIRKISGENIENTTINVNSPELRDSLVIVVGEKTTGSGFIAEFAGKKSIITNIHVLIGNKKLQFLDCNNHELDFSAVRFAEDRDIAVIELSDECKAPALPLEKDMSKYAVTDKVVVTGNSQGAGSVTRLEGDFKGLGPKVVEVTATFVHGNSGSPIISLKSGKVIGVATFAVKADEDWVNKGSGFENVRRFGTRIDNLTPESMKVLDISLYQKDMKILDDICNANQTCHNIIMDISKNRGMLTAGLYQDNKEMQKAVQRWNDAISSPRFGTSYMNALADMIKLTESPARIGKANKINYSFIGNEVKQQVKINELLVKKLKGLKTTLEDYRKRKWKQARGL